MILKEIDIFVEVPIEAIEEMGQLYAVTQKFGMISEGDASWETVSGLYLKKQEKVYVFTKKEMDDFIEQVALGKPIVKLL